MATRWARFARGWIAATHEHHLTHIAIRTLLLRDLGVLLGRMRHRGPPTPLAL